MDSVFDGMDLDSFLTETAESEAKTESGDSVQTGEESGGRTEFLTEEQAKEKVLSSARTLTNCIGMVTRTDATLSELEYRDLADTLAPGVCKLFNSEDELPPWVKQLLDYMPYMGMGFATLMFGFSVFRKVKTEKLIQAKREKELNPRKDQDNKTEGGADGDQSE
ncbi:hypothetical protein HMF8227_01448 [Saliniradius amylolyticus]|uniref:Uncharacterized protein n=1 Tax=Saliniradius amylolyticus TaxID=2183582 RepID=A0A2S2E2R1_9ALTE|nr:hypothetical protein [Saliniradius amylolyticus]AWL11923.1 hypothetical protein HMF8227_01448 [Saliniradius amylolyticus]